jgi:hypothetical protein
LRKIISFERNNANVYLKIRCNFESDSNITVSSDAHKSKLFLYQIWTDNGKIIYFKPDYWNDASLICWNFDPDSNLRDSSELEKANHDLQKSQPIVEDWYLSIDKVQNSVYIFVSTVHLIRKQLTEVSHLK